MSTVFDLVKAAGSIPLDELTVLSSEPAEAVRQVVEELQREGLVKVKTPDQATDEGPAEVVELTQQGFRRALR